MFEGNWFFTKKKKVGDVLGPCRMPFEVLHTGKKCLLLFRSASDGGVIVITEETRCCIKTQKKEKEKKKSFG